ncbi:MAG: Bax inhibitor-1/YccA family protein [Desulfarculus sp.]|nr:Bax inhibitor-1/YccA family protein [Pseudomonadota bacterium]MBV1715705.1 Bax inhibitor-1/YccA family protein [Desulfarculus sp.]MBU4577027.1 Bax inhibitor-1/YccA family protein [Pseudomonadota bacterium]MBU4597242.1 Bax inhibitor-1/YccA family protein [Pseudomonadota bacterium]MBV1739038.1 Bax inhibitor-1/YccA family protein [Desulfarculus sp.]
MQTTFTPPPLPAALSTQQQERVSAFMRRVYNWMAGGLALTGLVAWWAQSSEAVIGALFNPQTGGPTMLFWVLAIGELALVFGISGMINRLSSSTAGLLFGLYSALNGLTLSFIFLLYTQASLVSTFLITAGTFGAVSVWAYTTKRDLSGWGQFLFMGLIGIIIASVVNMFMASPMIYWIVSYVGVGIFVGLTAYDTQALKQIALSGQMDEETGNKMAIVGALKLYLDFINLFLMLLRVLGDRR